VQVNWATCGTAVREAKLALDADLHRSGWLQTRKTPPHDLNLARDRYRALLKKRAEDVKKK